MTMTYRPLFRGCAPLVCATPLVTVPAGVSVLKNVTIGNVANGIPFAFPVGSGGAFWTGAGYNGSLAVNNATVTFTPCADMGPDGTIYFAHYYGLYKIDLSGTITRLAGQDSSNSVHADGTGVGAAFNGITDIVVDSTGTNLYVSDGFYIRKVVIATGQVTTIAGTGAQGQTAHAVGTSALFDIGSLCIAPDDSCLYFIPFSGKHNANTGGIQKITLPGAVVSIVVASAVTKTTNVTGYAPNRIAVDSTNSTLWFTDCDNNGGNAGILKKVSTAGGAITTIGALGGSLNCIGIDWNDSNALWYVPYGSGISKADIINGVVQSSRNVVGNTTPAYGNTDGMPGVGTLANIPASLKIRGRYAVVMIFSATAAGSTQQTGMYRVNLLDGYLQCIMGTDTHKSAGALANTYTFNNCKASLKAPVRAKLWVLPNGVSTPSDMYLVGKYWTVDPGETLSMDLNIGLNTGDTIWAESLGPGASLTISGG